MIDAIVLGAGPAGAAAAVGLARLGAKIVILGRPRRDTIEGISARTLARLKAAGLNQAASVAMRATPRLARWAGEFAARGEEYLIGRERFDRSLRADLAEAGIAVQDRTATSMASIAGGWQVDTSSGPLQARSVIDARGRHARRAEQLGPRLLAWSELYRPNGLIPQGSAVVALEQGWCWLASTAGHRSGESLLLVQYIGTPGVRMARARFVAQMQSAGESVPELRFSLSGAALVASAAGRAAVARFTRPAQARGCLRIGDASLAMDPLSGHGIYEALGSAQVAVAAINTYLQGADWAPIARFVDERAAESWRRSLATAGDFYRRQATHAATEFWQATAEGYERLAAAAGPSDNGPGRFEWRPVLNGQRIELRPVWVSPAWPRGIWHVNGRELAGRPDADKPARALDTVYS
jgi:flavin-dependent dehydrogenase